MQRDLAVSRNAPCPCGSGKKYKHCCGGEHGWHALNERGIAACRNGNFSEGVNCFKRALERRPDSTQSWLNLGNAYQELQQTSLAIECYRRVAALQPDLPAAHYNLAVALEAAGEMEKAIESYRAALSLQPDYLEANYNLGAALHGKNCLEEAISWYEKALALAPRHANANFNLGVANAKLGRSEQAIEYYQRTLRDQPDAFDALTNLADLCANLSRDDEAQQYYERALGIRPSLARAHFGLGVLHRKRNQLDQARVCFARAVQFESGFLEAQHELGMTLIELGQLSEAVAPLQSALKLTRQLGVPEPNRSPNFASTSRSKLQHDAEQLQYLLAKGTIAPQFAPIAKQYTTLLEKLRGEFAKTHLVDLPEDALVELAPVYNRLANFYDAPRVSAAINPKLDAKTIEDDYRATAPGITHVDNFLTPEALHELRRFCLESTIWYNFKYPNGYLGASVDDGFYCPLLAQIAEELQRRCREFSSTTV
jgi:tetratricopeptide (TPR) repeat protein